ncbi:MAG: hypothetical protein JNM11_14200 [Chitinimonas sp.]|nr:hypothetical protein [Chitinimonas sp.]
MAAQPTPEELERYILDRFKKHNLGAGEVLLQMTIFMDLHLSRFRTADMNNALGSLLAKGWLVRVGTDGYALTAQGFAQM